MSQRTMPQFILPLAILLEFATLGATLWGWWLLRERTVDEDHIRFERLREQALSTIDARLESYEAALWGGAGLWNAQPQLMRSAWQAYVSTLNLDERFPGMLGMGYIHRVDNHSLATYLERQRDDEAPNFKIKPVPQGTVTAQDYLVISHVLPIERNQQAVGLDIGSESKRRHAAEAAAKDNTARITDVIQLVQDTKATPGYLVLVPISSSRDHNNHINAWVYAPIIGWQIFSGIVEVNKSEIAFTVFDGDLQDNRVIASSHSTTPATASTLTSKQVKNYAGRSWTFAWSTTPNFKSADQGESTTLLLAGIGLSGLLMFVLWYAHRSYGRAIGEALATDAVKRRIEEDLAQTLSSAALGLWDWNLSMNITDLTGPMCRRLGHTPGPTNEDFWLKTIHPDDVKEVFAASVATLKDPHKGFLSRYRVKTIEGTWIWILSRGSLCHDGRHDHIVGTLVDITELREKEEQLRASEQQARKAQEIAEAATRAKADFLATMSHEIRTPMNGVLGMSSLLADTSLSTQQHNMLETIRTCGESLLSLINDILDFSKIEAGKIILEKVDFDLRQIIDESFSLLAGVAHVKQLELLCEYGPTVPIAVVGDPGRIRQILVNLISNAIKFTERGHVLVRVSLVSGESTNLYRAIRGDTPITDGKELEPVLICLDIEDTGMGIPMEVQSKLFNAFTQADSSTTRKFGGTGLGLAICRRLIDLMAGSITITSAPGQGATFHIHLPLIPRKGTPLVPNTQLSHRRAIVIHEYYLARSLMQSMLQTLDIACDAAPDCDTALNIINAAKTSAKPVNWCLIDDNLRNGATQQLVLDLQKDTSLRAMSIILMTRMINNRPQINGVEHIDKPIRLQSLHQLLVDTLSTRGAARRFPTPSPIATMHGRILVAEDNAINQRLIAAMLSKMGLTVDVVGDGNEVLESINRLPYNLILMDCLMPEMDGYATTQEIRRREEGQPNHKRLTIIALTANAMDGDREHCLAHGMDDYLSKPIRVIDLQTMLIKWLATPSTN